MENKPPHLDNLILNKWGLKMKVIRRSETKRTCVRAPPRPGPVTERGLAQSAGPVTQPQFWSRTIMKSQPSVGAAADANLSHVQRAFPPGLTKSSAGRWIKATPRLFLTVTGEENGRGFDGARGRAALLFSGGALRVVTGPPHPQYTLLSACQGTQPGPRAVPGRLPPPPLRL